MIIWSIYKIFVLITWLYIANAKTIFLLFDFLSRQSL